MGFRRPTSSQSLLSWDWPKRPPSTLEAPHPVFLPRLSYNHVTSAGAEALLQALGRNDTILEVW